MAHVLFLIGQPGVFPLQAGALETARLKSMAFKPLKLQCPICTVVGCSDVSV